ncbi:hypothetical protein IE81DRAFT_23355 [Ceraceosorus guamensis]|uniref:RRM domain-containing protein n=1 Tax=Ceraceosorus guamensis TaxID=1522189 RepID=A0A316VSY0_9BASI|nr:hypothetical protein IE81DRAFT_23355 [Ceraceosorus guamensis]PWN39513.1 hypothetical protein IE81DRAFT_23355 [Ceraceosorus guamensis]
MMRRSPTPPGTRRISERLRKSNKWDVKPPGFEEMSAQQAKATGLFGTPGQSRGGAGTHAGSSLPPIRMGSDVAGLTDAQRQAAGLNGTLAARGLRRLYVGNVQPMATEGAFMSFFNAKMLEMNFASMPGEPCMSVQVNPDKGWAFLEFRTPEEATNAMGFDGIIFQGASLKIRRPKDYTGPDVNPPSNVHVPGVISTNVPDGPNKIYIGGLPTYLQEEQVIELLKSFGELRAFNLVREAGNGASKGYAFCEYVDHTLTEVACAGLNEMELGDRKLVVQKASSQSGGRNVNPMGATGSNMAPLGAPGAGGLTLPSAAANGTGEPTRAMTMLNMVTPKELEDDTEYGEILEDIAEECSKYGIISDIRIPRPVVQSKGAAAQNWKTTAAGSSGETDAEGKVKEREGVGRVYIRYEQVDQCQQALRGLAGRHFGGRTVICAFINEDDWPADEDGGIGSAGQEVAAA